MFAKFYQFCASLAIAILTIATHVEAMSEGYYPGPNSLLAFTIVLLATLSVGATILFWVQLHAELRTSTREQEAG